MQSPASLCLRPLRHYTNLTLSLLFCFLLTGLTIFAIFACYIVFFSVYVCHVALWSLSSEYIFISFLVFMHCPVGIIGLLLLKQINM